MSCSRTTEIHWSTGSLNRAVTRMQAMCYVKVCGWSSVWTRRMAQRSERCADGHRRREGRKNSELSLCEGVGTGTLTLSRRARSHPLMSMAATLNPRAIARTFLPARKADVGFRRIFARLRGRKLIFHFRVGGSGSRNRPATDLTVSSKTARRVNERLRATPPAPASGRLGFARTNAIRKGQ